MPTIRLILACLLALIAGCAAGRAQPVPTPASQPVGAPRAGASVATPEQHLGRPLGRDFELADWGEVSGYFQRLAAESPRVRTERVGTTTEGRDFYLSVISSEENLARLDEIKAMARRLADPRGLTDAQKEEALERGRVILFVSPAMHSTETGAPQFAMELAHLLATSNDEPWVGARRELVVCILPCTNPDGLDHVVEWYRKTVGTPHEASDLLRLYQLYAGHDNNRDWFMLSLAETRLVTRLLYSEWFPTVYWDVHQQGSSRERLFVPPFRDPLNPNLDPGIMAAINALGHRAVLDMTREGFTGVATGVSFDMWWNGGNRNVPVRHNIVGLLTEAASVRLATPIFQPITDLSAPAGLGAYAPSNQFLQPWPGGWWRLRNIIDYEHAFARSLIGSLAREPRLYRANALGAAERAIARGAEGASRAWILPADNRDPAAVRRLVDILLASGIELHTAVDPALADGRVYPPGSIVIRADQPYGRHVRDLFEVQRYPGDQPPYDVAGWTLPLLMGVRRVECTAIPNTELVPATSVEMATMAFRGDPRAGRDAFSSWHGDCWATVVERRTQSRPLVLATDPGHAGLLLPPEGASPADAARARTDAGRLGVYSPWSGSMDEGWLRWMLEHDRVPYVTVRNEAIRAGRLRDALDVLIIPSIGRVQLDSGRAPGTVPEEFTRALAPEGGAAIEEFVRTGGTLITLGSSSAWAIDLLRLPLVNVLGEDSAGDFSCPGSVLRSVPGDHWLTAGLPDSMAMFFSGDDAWREMTDDERRKAGVAEGTRAASLLRYAPERLLLSGWVRRPEAIEGRTAWARCEYGAGVVHLFAFSPHYRSWTQGTFQLIHRAAQLDRGATN